jgi:hypothetical protein
MPRRAAAAAAATMMAIDGGANCLWVLLASSMSNIYNIDYIVSRERYTRVSYAHV